MPLWIEDGLFDKRFFLWSQGYTNIHMGSGTAEGYMSFAVFATLSGASRRPERQDAKSRFFG
jgi:hypothetical protein